MTLASSFALFGSMVVLALIPGPGVLAVVGQTLSWGLRQGVSTVTGIVAGDFVFITLALFGLTALSELMGSFFVTVKYLGAAYLVWLGLSLMLSEAGSLAVRTVEKPNPWAAFASGLLTTLGNPKAILFYLSFFPAFLDLSQVTAPDAAILYAIATVAVGGVMLGYAWAASRTKATFSIARGSRFLRYGSGALLMGSGVFVAAKG